MKSSDTNNMTTGNIYRHILLFSIPVFISQLFQQLYNTADSIIVGRFLGTEALAAVSSSGPLIFLFTSFFEGVAVGAGVLISKEFGKGDEERVNRVVHTSLALSIIAGIILTVAGMLLTPKLLIWINTDPKIIPSAIEYFRIYFAGSLALALYNICRGIMMAVGDSKRPLYYLIFSSCLNVGLDILFVGGFGWGVWSAAFATVISQFCSCILCLARLCRKGSILTVSFQKLRLWPEDVYEILKYGVPSGIQNSVIGFANIIVQSQINSFGMIATATYGSYSKLEGFVFLPIMSFNMAITTFVSQNLGAKEYERAKKGARFGILGACVLAEILGILMVIFSRQLLGMFTDDEAVLALGAIEIGTIAPFYFLLAFSHSVAAVCRGAGKAFVPMFIMLVVWCGIRITYILTVSRLFGDIRLIYWAYPLTWTISSIIYLIYYLKSDWVRGFEKEAV